MRWHSPFSEFLKIILGLEMRILLYSPTLSGGKFSVKKISNFFTYPGGSISELWAESFSPVVDFYAPAERTRNSAQSTEGLEKFNFLWNHISIYGLQKKMKMTNYSKQESCVVQCALLPI